MSQTIKYKPADEKVEDWLLNSDRNSNRENESIDGSTGVAISLMKDLLQCLLAVSLSVGLENEEYSWIISH